MEARVLSRGHARQAPARRLQPAPELGRGQLHLSRPADADDARRLARAHPAPLPLLLQGPQRITHFSRLRATEGLVEQFVESLGPIHDAHRLGLLLFQLPPNFQADPGLLRAFLAAPALRNAAAPRIAFEFRHPSWFAEPVYQVLGEHDAALCIAESDDLASPEVHTAATHTSFRLRRTGGYTADELHRFAERFLALTREPKPREVFVYLKHEDEPTGALNAAELLRFAQTAAQSSAHSTSSHAERGE